ncbi:hypothetical protein [Prevotella sp.]|uniref:hypothetical protein n=1 Tax=Prevotella sp. TaxID=59823 RepID=UPI004027A833
MKKYILLVGMLLGVISAVDAAEQFVKFDKASADHLLVDGAAASLAASTPRHIAISSNCCSA